MKALINSAPGTRISLFLNEPLATAQTTGSSRSARTPVTCWALSARSSPSTPAVFFAATLLIRDTSSSRVAISSSRASRLEAKKDTSSYRDTLHYCRRQGFQPIIDQNALRPRSGGAVMVPAVMVPTGLQHAPQHAVLLHQLMQQGHADVAHHQDKQGPGDQRMDAAQGRHPFDVGGPTGHQLLAERGPAVAIANHDHQPGDRQQQHAQVKQPVAGLDQQSGRRILLGSVFPLPDGPENAQYYQYQQQRADGDVPGHQCLADPVLTVVDAVEELEELPDDQQPHAPVEEPG